jgi:hypothetical protein
LYNKAGLFALGIRRVLVANPDLANWLAGN